ncbi:MAG: M56 family metallopeptidase [Dysgonomonas sp.]|nr:M56 family metallopeptidase [Dysgonomonas sp.]
MEAFIIYILKSSLYLGAFLLIYGLFLRPTTFFRFNRFFLLLGLFASLIIPAIKPTYDVVIRVGSLASNIASETSPTVEDTALPFFANGWTLFFIIYMIGVFIVLGRNIYASRNVVKLIKNGTYSQDKNYRVINNKEVGSPFSVFNYILLNTNILSEKETHLILKHEETHVRQKHWVDLLCCECILLLQWFNPFVWVYVSFLKENHEFLADKAVLESGISPAQYQAVLINLRFQKPVFSFSNSFNYSKPLNRLNMMKKERSSAWKKILALTVLPVSVLFVWASATPNYIIETENEPLKVNTIISVIDTVIIDSAKADIKVTGYGSIKEMSKEITKDLEETVSKVSVSSFTITDDKKPLIIVDGKKVETMDNIDPNMIESIEVLKEQASISEYGEEGKNGVIKITFMPKEKLKEPVIIQIKNKNENKLSIISDTISVKKPSVIFNLSEESIPGEVLFIIDGEEVTAQKVNDLDIEKVESVTILKDKASTAIYGVRAKDGVVIVETKK